MAYSRSFFDDIRAGCQRSAKAVVPVVLRHLQAIPNSVIDVGCGEGWWAQAFHDAGVELAYGLDGDGGSIDPAPDVGITKCDLSKPIEREGAYDLAVSLEVAEHLPESRADLFVADLCALSDDVLFSAAIPRQGGTDHINCQPPAYWAEKFAKLGYYYDDAIRWDIWNDPDVEPWYKSAIFLYRHDPEMLPQDPPLHIHHPDLWLEPR